MNISIPHSTSNRGLSATSQAPGELEDSQKFLQIRDASRLSQQPKQLTLWESPPQIPAASAKLFRQKPQIVSVPGVSLKQQHRYRVTLGSQILGDRLNLDEALKLAKGGEV